MLRSAGLARSIGWRWLTSSAAVAKSGIGGKPSQNNRVPGGAKFSESDIPSGSLAVVMFKPGRPGTLALVKGLTTNGDHVQLHLPTLKQELIAKRQDILMSMEQTPEGQPWSNRDIVDLLKKSSDLATSVTESDLVSLWKAITEEGEGGVVVSLETASSHLFGATLPHFMYATSIILASPAANRFFFPLTNECLVKARNKDTSKSQQEETSPSNDTVSLFVSRSVTLLLNQKFKLPEEMQSLANTSNANEENEAGAPVSVGASAEDQAFIRDIESIALGSANIAGLPTQIQKLLLAVDSALKQSSKKHHTLDEAAAALLRAIGVWKDGRNLHLTRTPLVLDHHENIVAAANRLLSSPLKDELAPLREDMEGVAFAIDESLTAMDIDDAVGYEVVDGEEWVHIHVADVGAWISLGDPLDSNAADRCSTVYLPEKAYPMFPEVLSRNALSLTQGKECLAMTFSACLREDGSVKDSRVWASRVGRVRQVTYTQIDKALLDSKDASVDATGGATVGNSSSTVGVEGINSESAHRRNDTDNLGSSTSSNSINTRSSKNDQNSASDSSPHFDHTEMAALNALEKIAQRRRAYRLSKGSLAIRMPRSNIKLTRALSGETVDVKVSCVNENGTARGLVEECMLLAGQIAAGYAQARAIPFLYRVQVCVCMCVCVCVRVCVCVCACACVCVVHE
jgi:hypothetical protein